MLFSTKSILYFMLCCLLLTGCSNSHGNDIVNQPTENIVDDVNIEGFALPEWIGNYFEIGTYQERIRLSNSQNYSFIQVTDKIQIPESRLLSILFNTPLNSYFLYEDSKENIVSFVNALKELNIERQNEQSYNDLVKKQKDNRLYETEIFLSDAESNYIRISILTYKNGLHFIQVYQGDEVIYASATSNAFLDLLNNATKTKQFDTTLTESIVKIEYLDEDKWVESSSEYLELFKESLSKAEGIPNYSAGCPFELKLRATTENGVQYNIKYSTDDCGVLIIEDSSFNVQNSYRDMLRDVK